MIILEGIQSTIEKLKESQEEKLKALITAIKVEAFRLKKQLQTEIRQGAPGGEKFKPLREITKRTKKRHKESPLYALAAPISYTSKKIGDSFQVEIGYLDKGKRPISSFMKYLVKTHQEGKTFSISEATRRKFSAIGRPRYSIRKETKTFHIPARPIIEPFYKAHGDEAVRNIESNFIRKLRGERI